MLVTFLTFIVIRKCIVDELEMTVGLTWSPQNLRELTQESDKSRRRARPVCSESQRRRGRRRGRGQGPAAGGRHGHRELQGFPIQSKGLMFDMLISYLL